MIFIGFYRTLISIIKFQMVLLKFLFFSDFCEKMDPSKKQVLDVFDTKFLNNHISYGKILWHAFDTPHGGNTSQILKYFDRWY